MDFNRYMLCVCSVETYEVRIEKVSGKNYGVVSKR